MWDNKQEEKTHQRSKATAATVLSPTATSRNLLAAHAKSSSAERTISHENLADLGSETNETEVRRVGVDMVVRWCEMIKHLFLSKFCKRVALKMFMSVLGSSSPYYNSW